MNKKTLTIGFLSAMIAGSVVFASSASAFWPFDKPIQKGEVKAAVTDSAKKSGFMGLFKSQPVPTPTVTLSEDLQEDELTTEKLTIAVKNKLISETQRKEIQTRLAAIKAERQKLKTMREAFTAWLKTNNLERQKLIDARVEIKPSVTPPKPKVTTKPTGSPQPGCYYQAVQCIKAPCEKILVCPTPQATGR